MRTIVVDDEPWMLKRFAIECESLSDIYLMGSFRSPFKALEFASQNTVELAFLDVEMPGMNGLELAQRLREITPDIIIIFLSAYENYITEAFRTKSADYYVMKPYNTGDIETAVCRAKLLSGRLRKVLFVRTFGTFEIFTNNKPVIFQDEKDKELLALLIDRRGIKLSVQEVIEALWPNVPRNEVEIKFHRALKQLKGTLSTLHLDGIIVKTETGILIHTNVMDCDLYQFLDNDPSVTLQYSGEYMTGYDWAGPRRLKLNQQSKVLNLLHDAQTRNTTFANIRTLDNPERTISYMNDSFLSLMGYSNEELEKRFQNSFRAMVLREDYEHKKASVRKLFSEGKCAEVQYRLSGNNDAEVWVMCKSEPPEINAEGISEISSILIDISEAKAEQHKLEQPVHHDSLTGLYNSSFAQMKIEQYLASRNFTPSGVLAIVDVDNFKEINDIYGRSFADTVLTDIAAILNRSFRSSDIVCRLDGDKMMVFLKGIENEPAAHEKINAAFCSLRERLLVKTQLGELSCSLGGTMCPQNGSNFETLYSNALCALNKAKEKRNCTVWFSKTNMNGDII